MLFSLGTRFESKQYRGSSIRLFVIFLFDRSRLPIENFRCDGIQIKIELQMPQKVALPHSLLSFTMYHSNCTEKLVFLYYLLSKNIYIYILYLFIYIYLF